MKIYLDNCCYNRPFDDRRNIKNYLEREAVLLILQKSFDGEYEIYGSRVLDREIEQISSLEKKKSVEGLYNALVKERIELSDSIIARAKEIMQQENIKAFDSLHLASADMLITTDVKFLNACKRLKLSIEVKNPIEFVMEVNENGRID